MVEIFAGGGQQSIAKGVDVHDVALARPASLFVGKVGDSTVSGRGTIYIVDADLGTLIQIGPDDTIQKISSGMNDPHGISGLNGGMAGYIPAFADSGNNRIVEQSSDANPAVLLGNEAGLSSPLGVAAGYDGLYIADTANQRILFALHLLDTGKPDISTVVGTGVNGFAGDGGQPTDAELSDPSAIAYDDADYRLLIADSGNHRLRSAWLGGSAIETIAGNGETTSLPYDPTLAATDTPLSEISAVDVDSIGSVYFPVRWSDIGETVMRLDPYGTFTRIVGGGTSTAGGVASLNFQLPDVLALELNQFDGSLLIGAANGVVYRVAGVGPFTSN